jgi:hypothetical protein
MPFFIQIATSQSEAQLMAECPLCGAMTYIPLTYAWTARSVSCCDCATTMPVARDDMMKLKAQASDAVAEMDRLMRQP